MRVRACMYLALLAIAALGQKLPPDDLQQAIPELRGNLLVISGLRFEGQLQAWHLPRECAGRRPSDCRSSTALDYSLEHVGGGGWTLSITRGEGHPWRGLEAVTVWCEGCQAQQGGASAPSDAPLATLEVRGGRKPCRFARSGTSGSTVAVVLRGGHVLLGRQQEQASFARRLQQASDCSLTVDGTATTFDACSTVGASNTPFTLYYTLSPSASGGTVFRGGMRVQQSSGWAGWGLGSAEMQGSNAVIAKADPSSGTGASIAGYVLPSSYSTLAVNQAAGKWAITDAAAALTNGELVAVFTVELPGSVSSLTAKPFNYIWAVGPVSSSTRDIRQHAERDSDSLTLKAPSEMATPAPAPAPGPAATSTPTRTPTASLAPSPASTPASPPTQAPAPQPSTSSPPTAKKESACSLTVAGAAHSFDACSPISPSNTPYTLYYSLAPAANGGTVFRGGMRVQQSPGWAGWGLDTKRMVGSNAVVAKADSSSPTGASVAGYVLPSYNAKEVNAAKGTWPIKDAAAELAANGELVAVFTVELPGSVSSLTAKPFNYIWAMGTVSSATGAIRDHEAQGSTSLTLKAPTPEAKPEAVSSPPASSTSPSPSPSRSPSPVPAPPPAPVPEPAATISSTSQNCQLVLPGGANQAFPACANVGVAVGSPLNVMWRVLPPVSGSTRRLHQAPAPTSLVLFAFNGTTLGGSYIAVGFAESPGLMPGASAFIVKDCDSCPTGAKLQDYFLGGYDSSSITSPSRLKSSNFTAARTTVGGQSWLSASFLVELPTSRVEAAQANILLATGGLSSSGSILQHDAKGDVDVALARGSVGTVNTGGNTNTKKAVHGWLMIISWGVLIPGGIVMARCFKELDPLWFHAHRIIQSLAFATAVAGFAVGFSIRRSWDTPYTVHRNLGVAVMSLAVVQMTALFARPAKTSAMRPFWDLGHWWIGRAAAACAIGNIYYGILHVDKLGKWAWASYTAVLCVIVAVAVVKDSLDFMQGKRKLGFWSTNGPKKEQHKQPEKSGMAPPTTTSPAGSDNELVTGPKSNKA